MLERIMAFRLKIANFSENTPEVIENTPKVTKNTPNEIKKITFGVLMALESWGRFYYQNIYCPTG